MQLTKNVSELVPGDVFYKGEIVFTVLEVEAPELRPVTLRRSGKVENMECIAIRLLSGNITGWEHFPVGDTVCTVSPKWYAENVYRK